MKLERKIEILKQYNYGKLATLQREEIINSEGCSDRRNTGYQNQAWGTQVLNMKTSLSMLVNGKLTINLDDNRESLFQFFQNNVLPKIQDVQTAYGFFSMVYSMVVFDEIEMEIDNEQDREDLSPLHDTNERIKKLGPALQQILILARKNTYESIEDNPEYQENYKIIQEFSYSTQNYRNKISELETRLKEVKPIPS